MIYYGKKIIEVAEEGNYLLWQACMDLSYDGRTVVTLDNKSMFKGRSDAIILPSTLSATIAVEPFITNNLVLLTIIPAINNFTLEIVYQSGTDNNIDEEESDI